MYLSLEYFQHPGGNDRSYHIAEVDGIRYVTSTAILNRAGMYEKQRIGGLWYISGVRVVDWPDGNQYHAAVLEYAENKSFLKHVSHQGWHLPDGEHAGSDKVQCYVPGLRLMIQAGRKSKMIHLPRGPSTANVGEEKSIWIGLKHGEYYFAGLNDATDLRIRKGRYEPDPTKRSRFLRNERRQ